jgi:hypothetical protein
VGFLLPPASNAFENLIASSARDQVSVSLGDGVFNFYGAQLKDCPELTVWCMSRYGAEVGHDPQFSSERCKNAYGITFPKQWLLAREFLKLFDE